MKKTNLFIIILSLITILVISGCTSKFPQSAVLQLGATAPDATFTTIDGKTAKLSDYKGEKVMFWYFATWCSSCIKAAEVLEKSNAQLNGMKVIALKTYGNAGYGGPSISEFGQKYAPDALKYNNWIWGDATQQATSIYNSRNYPDIFYLVDENGILQAVDGAPAAVMNKIIAFAQGS